MNALMTRIMRLATTFSNNEGDGLIIFGDTVVDKGSGVARTG